MITLEHLFQLVLDSTDLHNNRSAQILATMSGIKDLASAIQSSQSDLQTQLTGIKTSVDKAVSDLTSALESNNAQQLDAVMTILTAIQTQVGVMATGATSLQTELTNAIGSIPMPASVNAGRIDGK